MRASRFITVVLNLGIAGAAAVPAAAQSHCVLRGDLNMDEIVNGADLEQFVQCLLGQQPAPSECHCGDFNGDGRVDPLDVQPMVDRLLGLGPPTGACCSFAHPMCVIVTRAECDQLGVYHGDGTTCAGDINRNGFPDPCEADCNGNGIPDEYEIGQGWLPDCDGDGMPDPCELDCNQNGTPDDCEVLVPGNDCNRNRRPDDCDIAAGRSVDCNANGIPDECELEACVGSPACRDCNRNGVLDECDLAAGTSRDCDQNGQPDDCARCLIPGDMNGDRLVNLADEPLFMMCFSMPCAPVPCVCADLNSDGVIDATDQMLFNSILAGTTPQQTMAIIDFNPKTVSAGDIVLIDGFGFDNRAPNLSIAARAANSTTAVPLELIEVVPLPNGNQRIRARVGGIDYSDQPGILQISTGEGTAGPFPFQHPGAQAPLGGRRWRSTIQTSTVPDDHRFYDDNLEFATLPCWVRLRLGGFLQNGLELPVLRGYARGTSLDVHFLAWDTSAQPAFGVEGRIPSLLFTADKNAVESAQAIAAAVTQLFQSFTPPVQVTTTVTPVAGGAVIRAALAGMTIDLGRLGIREPEVEIEVNDSAATDDDYLTWAPTKCRARVSGYVLALIPSITVVLTNDDPNPSGAGNVRFADYVSPWPAATTATATTLTLTLPTDGTWVSFVMAGEYGSPSTNDEDAVIEAHRATATGDIIGRKCVMVRVRKDANTLTTGERDRYVDAILALNDAGGYEDFQSIHALASSEAHR